MLYQQGDVLFKRVQTDLQDASPVPKRNGRFVLAEGEATGHAHAVTDDVDFVEKDGCRYVAASAPFTVTHEEHKQIRIPEGTWLVEKVREYDHFAEQERTVWD